MSERIKERSQTAAPNRCSVHVGGLPIEIPKTGVFWKAEDVCWLFYGKEGVSLSQKSGEVLVKIPESWSM